MPVWVDPIFGDDDDAGTEAEPWQTLAKAVTWLTTEGAGTVNLARGSVFSNQLDLIGVVPTGAIVIEGNGSTIDLGIDISNGNWVDNPDGDGVILDQAAESHTLPIASGAVGIALIFADDKPMNPFDDRFGQTEPDPGQLGNISYNGNDRLLAVFRPGVSLPKDGGTSTILITSGTVPSCVEINKPNITVRNLICKHGGNDGFNVRGGSGDYDANNKVKFEDCSALLNGDEGFSCHDDVFMLATDCVTALNGSLAGQTAEVGTANTEYVRTVALGDEASTSHTISFGVYVNAVVTVTDAVIDGTVTTSGSGSVTQSGVLDLDTVAVKKLPAYFWSALEKHFELQTFTGLTPLSDFDTIYSEAVFPPMLSQSGDTITFTPAGGAGVVITAVVGAIHHELVEHEGGRFNSYTREVVISKNATLDTYLGVAAPKPNATVLIDGEVWAVVGAETETPSTARLTLSQRRVAQESRTGFTKNQ